MFQRTIALALLTALAGCTAAPVHHNVQMNYALRMMQAHPSRPPLSADTVEVCRRQLGWGGPPRLTNVRYNPLMSGQFAAQLAAEYRRRNLPADRAMDDVALYTSGERTGIQYVCVVDARTGTPLETFRLMGGQVGAGALAGYATSVAGKLLG